MKKILLSFLYLLLFLPVVSAQRDTTDDKIYKVNRKWELPAAAGFLTVSYFGFRELDDVATLNEGQVKSLHPDQLNSFDRSIAFMDPSRFDEFQKKSDLFLNISVVSPVLLALDRRVRKDWLDLVTMFAFTHTVDNTIYFASAYSVRRARPLTYNPDLPLEKKTGEAKSNSFFSGHVSFSTTSTFFAVKVFTDYHHIRGWKRIALYGAASVPPALVGYYRMKAGKHFKTDVITGFLIGAASGIGVPELHRLAKRNSKLTLEPLYMPGYSGLTVNLHL